MIYQRNGSGSSVQKKIPFVPFIVSHFFLSTVSFFHYRYYFSYISLICITIAVFSVIYLSFVCKPCCIWFHVVLRVICLYCACIQHGINSCGVYTVQCTSTHTAAPFCWPIVLAVNLTCNLCKTYASTRTTGT